MTETAAAVNNEAISGEYFARVKGLAEAEVRRRSLYRAPAYFALYLVILFLTPLHRRHADPSLLLGVALLLLGAVRWYAGRDRKDLQEQSRRRLLKIANISLQLNAALWGGFCALTVAFFELGWTSFLSMLLTCALCAAETSALAPSYRLLVRYLALMLVPAAVLNLAFVGELRGGAICGFFLGYLSLLCWVGRIQFIEYWQRLRENARMMAMIDAMPGTVAWISSDLTYLGVNRNLASQLGVRADRIVGVPLDGVDGASPLIAFARALFVSPSATRSSQAKHVVDGQPRDYFLFGQKYNQETEAIVVGLDMTDSSQSAAEIGRERAQRYFAARQANRGTALAHVARAYGEFSDKSTSQARRLEKALLAVSIPSDSGPHESLHAFEILEDAAIAFGPAIRAAGGSIEVHVDSTAEIRVEAIRGQLIEALLSIFQNALDAQPKAPRIDVRVARVGEECHFIITDPGPGVPLAIRERIFEPLFSAKQDAQGSGLGLSIALEVAENHNGRLWLDSPEGPTRFVLALPISK